MTEDNAERELTALGAHLSAGGTRSRESAHPQVPHPSLCHLHRRWFLPHFTSLPARGLAPWPAGLRGLRAGLHPTRLCDWLAPQAAAPATCRSPPPRGLPEQQPLLAPRLVGPHGSGSQQTGLLKEMLPCLRGDPSRPTPQGLPQGPPHSLPSRLGGLRTHHAFSISTAHRAPHVAGGTEPLLKKPPRNWRLGDSKGWNPQERGVSTASLEHPGWSESRAHQNQLRLEGP